jgi:hypothetical protein
MLFFHKEKSFAKAIMFFFVKKKSSKPFIYKRIALLIFTKKSTKHFLKYKHKVLFHLFVFFEKKTNKKLCFWVCSSVGRASGF